MQPDTLSLRYRLVAMSILALLVVGSVAGSLYYRIPALMGMGLSVVMLMLIITDYRSAFLLLVASIPLSISVQLGSLATYLPSEPLMVGFTLIFIFAILQGQRLNFQVKVKLFPVLLFFLLGWTLFSCITSVDLLRSFKYLAAKLWYVAAFVGMGSIFMRDERDIKKIFEAFLFPLVLVIAIITVWHLGEGFSFEASHKIVNPFFANGVVYGAALALFIPYIWFARSWYAPRSTARIFLWIALGLAIIGIVLSYKRGAWLAVLSLPLVYVLLRKKWLSATIYASLGVIAVLILYLLIDNTYYKYAPDFSQTIWHEGDLSGHLNATLEGTEISSVERFYRWVAAKNMLSQHPLTGTGPSTFNITYKTYADDAFRTYVSDNPEQSTTHNYFLMTFAEQGWVGGFLFLALSIGMILRGINIYNSTDNEKYKQLITVAILSLYTILLHSLLNEMIEVDKIGAFFWINLLVIHKVDVWAIK